jgi:imidazolonepropionase-like amidohydrolase
MHRLRSAPDEIAALAALAVGLALTGALAPGPIAAAPPDPPDPLAVHALTGARIVVAPGRVIDSGTVVIRDGVIEAVGADVAPPADARVWDLEGLTVYPGLVEPYAVRSWPEEDDQEESGGDPGAGDPSPVVHAEREMAAWGLEDRAAGQLREGGYAAAAVAPGSGLMRGWSAVVSTGDGPLRETLMVPRLAQHVRLRERGDDGYPESLMGAIALTRETFLEAGWYRDAWSAYGERPAQRRPPRNAALEALLPAVNGEAPVVFESESLLGTLRAGRLAGELGLDAWIVGSGEEYRRAEEVAGLGAVLLVPLAFPETPAPGDDALALELDELRHWRRAPGNAAALLGAGIEVVVTSFGLDAPKELHAAMGRAIEAGLPADEALAAVTTRPARLLGLGDRLGTVEAGRIANLVVTEGELFTEATDVREVWVDGRRYEIEERQPPEVEPAGTWELDIDAGDDQMTAVLELTGEAPSLDGRMTVQGVEVELSSVEVSGASVTIEFDGAPFGLPGPFQLTLDVEGDRARGGGSGPPGSFTLEGTRVSGPGGADTPEEELR